MKKIFINELNKIKRIKNKIFFFLWFSISVWYWKKIIQLLLFLNILAWIKLAYVFYKKKKNIIIDLKNIIDNKLYLLIILLKTKTNKNIFFIFCINYFLIFFFTISLKSVSLSINIYESWIDWRMKFKFAPYRIQIKKIHVFLKKIIVDELFIQNLFIIKRFKKKKIIILHKYSNKLFLRKKKIKSNIFNKYIKIRKINKLNTLTRFFKK